MKRLVVLSSFVATSRVGGAIAPLVGPALGVDPFLIPTTLLGRHPGLGPPGGAATPDEVFAGMLNGAKSNGALGADAILTGYFASAAQVEAAAAFIDEARTARPDVILAVDPIMGDDARGLYIREATAQAVARLLVPRADLLTPNLWEFRRIWAPDAPDDPRALVQIARESCEAPMLITSVRPADASIGALYVDKAVAWLAQTPRMAGRTPNGAGDVLALAFLARRLNGETVKDRLAGAVGFTHAMLRHARDNKLNDLPVGAASHFHQTAPYADVSPIGEDQPPAP